ncbi:MAG: hypothetical protein ACRD4X_12960 [Candidatus Acidiferrales bacterium]
MRKSLAAGAVLIFALSISWTVGAKRAAAQGPAGAGAAQAAQDSSHSLNPMKWIKKDSTSSDDANRSDLEKKLTQNLHASGVLAANSTATEACAPFITLDGCLAALHASHNLGVNFYCLRADITGVHTSVDVSGCKVADGDKAHGLDKAIRQLKPDARAKQAAKDAEQQAADDLNSIGG